MPLEIIEADHHDRYLPTPNAHLPPEHALRGFHGVTLRSRRSEATLAVLQDLLGYRILATEADRTRLVPNSADSSPDTIDVIPAPAGEPLARLGVGGVHHIAFRSSARNHPRFLHHVAAAGHRITPARERIYFRSLYFRETGGVLVEIATDDPGFTADEPLDSLGSSLRLPPWLEPHRKDIEAALPALPSPHP